MAYSSGVRKTLANRLLFGLLTLLLLAFSNFSGTPASRIVLNNVKVIDGKGSLPRTAMAVVIANHRRPTVGFVEGL